MGAPRRKRSSLDPAAKIVFGYLAIIDANLPKVRANRGGLEPLHQLRVTLRRLRNAFWIFKKYLPETQVDRWKASLRSSSVYSGEARDLDVQILFLTEYMHHNSPKRFRIPPLKIKRGVGGVVHPLEKVVARMRQRRLRLQKGLSSSLGQLQKRKTLSQIKAYFRNTRIGDTAKVRRIAERRITKRMEQLLEFDHVVSQLWGQPPRRFRGCPQDAIELHQMRIAGKHLRYTLEAFRPVYGKPVEKYISDMIVIQRALGVVHDMDVWLGGLKGKKGKWVRHFGNFCLTQRREGYKRLATIWKQYKKVGFWKKLQSFSRC